MYTFNVNSRINTTVDESGTIETQTVNQPSGLVVEARSTRRGRDGTTVKIGFDRSPNRNIKLDGFQARALYRALHKHYNEF